MPKQINPAFGQRLQELREAAGLTQAALAEKSGVPLGSVREVEQGRREPLFGVMQRLAAVLKADLGDFPPTTTEEEVDDKARHRGRPRRASAGGD